MNQKKYSAELRRKGSELASDIIGIGSVLKEAFTDGLGSVRDMASERFVEIQDDACRLRTKVMEVVNMADARVRGTIESVGRRKEATRRATPSKQARTKARGR